MITMRDIKELTYDELDRVAEFIRMKVDVTIVERHSHNVHLEIANGEVTVKDTYDSDEFIEGDFENYWCDECQAFIIEKHCSMSHKEGDKALFEHVMKHLGIE
jgi:hypothetical protein